MGTHRNLRDKLKSCQIFLSHKSITHEYLVLNEKPWKHKRCKDVKYSGGNPSSKSFPRFWYHNKLKYSYPVLHQISE